MSEERISLPNDEPYPIWHDVPVQYDESMTLEQKLKHRIRRAAEKCEFGGDAYSQASLTWDKLLDVPEFRMLIGR